MNDSCVFLRKILSSVLDTSNTSPHRSRITNARSPAPWWNDKCAEAVEHRRTMCRIYKANPTWDNWRESKRSNSWCQKVLKRKKKIGWRNLSSSFSYRTPTSEKWRFMKAYKSKTISRGRAPMDSDSLAAAQDLMLSKLCPPSCLHRPPSPLELLIQEDISSLSPHVWLDDPFSQAKLDLAIDLRK